MAQREDWGSTSSTSLEFTTVVPGELTPLLASSGTRHKHATDIRSGRLPIHSGSKATIKYATWEGSLEAS